MSDSPTNQRMTTAFSAPVLVGCGILIAVAAWLLPANLKSVSPMLLRAAGAGTPSLGAYGRDLADVEKIGPAALVLAAAKTTNDPRAPALARAVDEFATRKPGLMAWGGWDPFLDPLFNLRADSGRRESTPVLTFFNTERARLTLRTYLEKSGSEGVQSLLKLRELTATGRFVPAMRPGGQPLDALILMTGLLYQGGHLSPPLQRELRTLAETALQKKELGELENVFVNLLSLGRRLDWAQIAELLRRTDSSKTVGEYAHLARVAPDQLPLIYAAALFSDSADRVAAYLIEYGKTGLEDLKMALGFGQGAARELLLRRVPINHTRTPALSAAAELALTHPQLTLALKYLGVFAGVWLLLRGLDRWLVRPGTFSPLPLSLGHMKAGMISVLFALLLLVVTEPFLLQAAPASEFQLRRPVLVLSSVLATSDSQPSSTMEATNLISIGVFAVLQIAVYFLCLMKIREVSQQTVPPLVKLRLMENEENLFDLGLYVGIGGTAVAMVLITLGIAKANLIAAFSSNLFGITCVALVKIYHVRPYKRQLILEGQIAATTGLTGGEPIATSSRGSAAL
ncbi:hypothetical protein [Horticoccus sp. 23ND18S-11]|uniref:hypothetical protein n=1 Tax=Horticoccus sp. 23ND18S-11 TaxID=3391832 RepID=UPI0039C9C948